MCEKREKRLDRSLPRSPRTRSASPPDARASPPAETWPVSGINSQLLSEGFPGVPNHLVIVLPHRVPVDDAASVRTHIDPAILLGVPRDLQQQAPTMPVVVDSYPTPGGVVGT